LECKRKREEAYALLESRESELKAILDNSQVGIMHLKGGRFLANANQRLADILGYDTPEEMTEIVFERLILESNTRQAIENDEFILYYQPQYNANTKVIIGVEALIRWQHPSLGIITPSKFIPLAEETGLIIEIDNWVMKTAMKEVNEWYESALNPRILSLNLAIKQLESSSFIKILQTSISDSSFNPKNLKLKILESDVMRNPKDNIEKLNTLHHLRIKLAIDDFGTGQLSLTCKLFFSIIAL